MRLSNLLNQKAVLVFLVFILLCLCFFPVQVSAQTDTLHVYGQVTTPNAAPVHQAKITCTLFESTVTTLTNSDGFYTIKMAIHDTPVLSVSRDFPANFHLSQNYPNPFFESTTISFILPGNSSCKLTIMNTLGQVVRVLDYTNFQPGPQQVLWDGTDQGGRRVAKGIYFYRLETPDGMRIRKMLLLDHRGFGFFSNGIEASPLRKQHLTQYDFTIQAEKDSFDLFDRTVSLTSPPYEIQRDIVLQPCGYFPLTVGNHWTMVGITSQNIEETESFSISEKLIIDEKDYYQFSGATLFLPVRALVSKNEKGDILIRGNDQEHVLYQFSEPILDSIRIIHLDSLPPLFTEPFDIRVTLQSIHDTVTTPLGKFDNCYRFVIGIQQAAGSGSVIKFSREFGPVSVRIYSAGFDYLLTEFGKAP